MRKREREKDELVREGVIVATKGIMIEREGRKNQDEREKERKVSLSPFSLPCS